MEQRRFLAAVTWTGNAGDSLWNTPGNWSGNAVPGFADDVTISVAAAPTIQITGTQSINSLVSDEALTLNSGSLSLAAASQLSAAFTLGGGTLGGAGDVTISSGVSLAWTGGTMNGAGRTLIAAGATLNMSGGTHHLHRTLENAGTTNWTAGDLSMNGGRFDNNGALNANCAGLSTLQSFGAGGTNTFNNNAGATFTKLGTGTATITVSTTGVTFNNAGTVSVQAGTLRLGGGGTNSSAVSVSASAALQFNNTYTHAATSSLSGAGALTITTGTHTFPVGTFTPTGAVSFSGGTIAINNAFTPASLATIVGNVTFNSAVSYAGALNVTGSANFAAAQTFSGLTLSGTLSGVGDITVSGAMNWTGGTMSGPGLTTVAAGGTLAMSGAPHNLQRVLQNDGTATWTAGDLVMTGGAFNNNGSFTANNAGSIGGYATSGATNAFNNNAGATFTKQGAGTASFTSSPAAVAFNNAGAVSVQAGTLQVAAGGTDSSAISVAAGGTMQWSGTYTHTANSTLTGAGTMTFSGGTHSFPSGTFTPTGTVNFSGSTTTINNTFTPAALGAITSGTLTLNAVQSFPGLTLGSGGTITGTGDITVTGAMTWTGGTLSGTGSATIAAGGGTLNLSGNGTLARVLQNNGATTWTGGIFALNGATFNNNGTFTANVAAGTAQMNGGGGTNSFNNNPGATFTKQGAGGALFTTSATGVPFNNSGAIDVQAGSLRLEAGGTHTTDTAVASGATFQLNGTHNFGAASDITGAGNLTVTGGTLTHAGTVNVGGAATFSAGTSTFTGPSFAPGALSVSTGTVTLSTGSAVAVGTAATSTFSGGTLTGSADITFAGTLNWTAGTMSGTGQTTIAANATLSLGSSGTKNLNRTLHNNGAATWTQGLVSSTGGTFNNNGSLTANLSTAESWRSSAGTNAFNNNAAAIFTKLGAATATFSVLSGTLPFNSLGTVNVQAGTLTLSGGVSQHVGTTLTGGTWTVGAAGTLNVTTGNNITTNQAVVTLDGPASTFAKINSLTNNAGTFVLAGGRDFAATPAGGTFMNSGLLDLGPGSTLSVAGAFTHSGAASLHVDIAGPLAATDFGQVSATGVATLDGGLTAAMVNGYDPGPASTFAVVTGASRSGMFATFTGTSAASGRLLFDVYDATSALVSVGPAAPAAPDLDAASDSGLSDADNVTSDATPTLTGSTTDDGTVSVFADGILIGTITSLGGLWSITAPTLADGPHVITATVVDAEGEESPLSASLSITVDTAAPLTPGATDLQAASDSGFSSTDNITNDATPTLSVISTDAFYRVRRNAVQVSGDYASATAFTDSTVPHGAHAYTVRAVDLAGNVSPASAELSVTVDTVAPAAGFAPHLQAASDSGVSQSDDVTSDNTPTIAVTSTDTYYRVFRGATQVTGDYANAATFTDTPQADGTRAYTVRSVDTAGNVSPASAALNVMIDTAAPAAPTAPDLQAASDSGVSATDNITNDNTPTLSLTSTDLYYRLFRGATQASGDYASGASFTESPPQSDGVYAYTLRAVDAAGNVSSASTASSVTIDTTAPAVPAAPDLQAASDSGVSSTDNFTNDNTPTLAVTTTDAFYRLFRGATQLTGDYANAATHTDSTQADATIAYTVRALDAAGNVSAASGALSVTVDTLAPATPSAPDLQSASDTGVSTTDNITADATPTLDVTLTDAFYRLLRGGVQVTGDYTSAATFTDSSRPDGSYAYTVRAVDAAGNVSTASSGLSVTIDTLAPVAPPAPDLQAASDSGSSSTDNITNDPTPTLDIASSDLYYRLFRGLTQLTGDYATAATFTDTPLADGPYTYTLRGVDAAGNVSAAGSALPVTIDTAAPLADVLDVTPDPRSSAVSSLTITFTRVVTGFDLADLSLTRDGSPVSLAGGGPALSSADNVAFTLSGLDGLTATAGQYVLTLTAAGSGIADSLAGNALLAGASDTWQLGIDLPAWLDPGSVASWSSATKVLTVTGATMIIADPGPDAPTINASGAAAVLTIEPVSDSAVHIAALNLSNGATAALTSVGPGRSPSNHRVLVVSGAGISIDATSWLDLADNDLVIDYDPNDPSPVFDVQALLASGYNFGSHDGPGIISTAALNMDPFSFGLGYADNASLPIPYGSVFGGPLFAGQDLDDTCVLIKFTWVGDVTLDGIFDFQDLSIFNGNYDSGAFNGRLWTDGDLNFDGVIDFQDLSLFNGNYDLNKPPL